MRRSSRDLAKRLFGLSPQSDVGRGTKPLHDLPRLIPNGNSARGRPPERPVHSPDPMFQLEYASLEHRPTDGVEHGLRDVGEALHALVADDRNRAPLGQPREVVHLLLGERLFHHHDVALLEPAQHVERDGPVLPPLVDIGGDRLVGH